MLQEFFVINCKISMHGDVWLVFNSTAVNFAKGQAMSSNDTGTPPHTPANGAQPAPLEAKALQDKNMERLRGYASFSYQLVIAVGAVITFAYLFSINFFPVGLTAGEVVLFVFIALAFGFVYSIFWLYGTFSALWAFQTVLWIVYKLRTLYHSLLHERRPRSDIYLLHTARWRPGKRWQPTRIRRPQRKNIAAYSQKMLLPHVFQGCLLGLSSLMTFMLMAAVAFSKANVVFTEFLEAFFFSGIFTLLFLWIFSNIQKSTDGKAHGAAPSYFVLGLVFVAFPLGIVIFFIGVKALLYPVFAGIGIRMPNVSIELPESERDSIDRAAEALGRPLLDCRRTAGGRLLVHDADIIWTAVGSVSLVQFNSSESSATPFGTRETISRKVDLRIDTANLHIIKAVPQLDPCFDISSDMAFQAGSHVLSSAAVQSLKEMVAAIKMGGTPAHIMVRSHGDADNAAGALDGASPDHQNLLKLRAGAVAELLTSLLSADKPGVTSESAGSHEPRVNCPSDQQTTAQQVEQCNVPNRRVEVYVSYARPNTGDRISLN